MKKNINSILLLIAILFATKCNENPVTRSVYLNDYTPYKVGAFWSYKATTPGFEFYLKEEVILKEDNGYYLVMNTSNVIDTSNNNNYTIIDTNYVRFTDEGLMVSVQGEIDRYVLKKPYRKGTKWSWVSSDSIIYNLEIVEDSLTVNTPAGTFNQCLKVIMWLNNPYNPLVEYIFAPNVGIVTKGPFILQFYRIPII